MDDPNRKEDAAAGEVKRLCMEHEKDKRCDQPALPDSNFCAKHKKGGGGGGGGGSSLLIHYYAPSR